ncbi:hypothetical protein ACFE04_004408 [Oxalis oulophora]
MSTHRIWVTTGVLSKPAGNDAIGVDLATKNENPKCPTPLGSYHTLEIIHEATPEEIKSETNDLWGRKIPPNERKVMDNIHEASPEELKLLWPRAEYAIDGNRRSKIPTPLSSYHTLENIREATPEEIKSETNDLWGRKIPPNERKVMDNIHEASPEELKLLWPRAEYAIDGNRRSKIPTPLSSYHTLENIREATPEEIKSETNDLWGRKIPPNERKVMDNIHEASPEELKLLWPRAEYAIDGNRRSKIPTPLSSYHTLENIREATPEEIKSETNDLWGRKIPPNERKVMDNIHEASSEELKLETNDLWGRKIPPNERKVMDNIHEASPEELKLLWPRAEYAIDGNRRSKIPTPLSSYHTLENIREATPEEIKSETNDLWGRKIPPNERKVMDNIHEASPEELKLSGLMTTSVVKSSSLTGRKVHGIWK